MGGRQWKPGDVAMVRASNGQWKRAWFGRTTGRGTPCWWYCDSETWTEADREARPLVVIDPDDASDVGRLAGQLFGRHFDWRQPSHCQQEDVRVALHRLIAPPKPDEPLGVGAVVIDSRGNYWTRIADGDVDPVDPIARTHSSPPWRHRGVAAKWWAHLDVDRVLSEGVQP